MAGQTSEPGRSVTSRALALLGAFDERHPRLTLTDLARRSGLPPTTTHRLLGQLESWGALVRGRDGSYAIGQRLWHLGLLAPVQTELRCVAIPYMQDLYDTVRENVHLAVRDGVSATYVERIHGRASVPLLSRAGARLPLHATGVGKVLLAHAPAPIVARVLSSLTPVTQHTLTDAGRVESELAETRLRGFARTSEEMTLGTYSVAVPVTGAEGRVVAALGVVTGAASHDVTRWVMALQVTAASIGRGLSRASRAPGSTADTT